MIERIPTITFTATALLLLAIALSAPSLLLMLRTQTQNYIQFQIQNTIGISVLSTSISFSFIDEFWELGFVGLACGIGGLLLSDGEGKAASCWRTGIRMWASAAAFAGYLAYRNTV